jgi:3-hydroxyisobutyrate dehydrogenase-like beta-hydroxyacid dehydrogenase
MTTVGFLGAGSMGSAMIARLLQAGHDVRVWNRSPGPLEMLAAAGARIAHEPNEALASDISFCMLANDDAADAALSSVQVGTAPGRIHVMMASISPAMSHALERRLRLAGTVYVAAPVLGRPPVAAAGQLNILAAGPADALDTVEPYLLAMGKHIWRFGDVPAVAHAVKVVVNYNIIHALQALGESVTMTERLGVEPQQIAELLAGTLFGGVVYEGYGKLIAHREYSPPGFRMELGRKDLRLAEEIADSVDFRPATLAALVGVFETALTDPELTSCDWSAIAEVSRRNRMDEPRRSAEQHDGTDASASPYA